MNILKTLSIHLINFVYYNFYRYKGAHNWALPAHIIIMLLAFWFMPYFDIDGFWKWVTCLSAAIVWECFEFIFDHEGKLLEAYFNYDVNFYDGRDKYWYDTIGDVIIPLFICLISEVV